MRAAKELQMAPLLHNITMWRDKNEGVSSVQHQNALSLSSIALGRIQKSIFSCLCAVPPLSGEANNL